MLLFDVITSLIKSKVYVITSLESGCLILKLAHFAVIVVIYFCLLEFKESW